MARRMTAAEKRALEEQSFWERYEQRRAAAASNPDTSRGNMEIEVSPWRNVQSGSSTVPAEDVSPWDMTADALSAAIPGSVSGDQLRSFGTSVANIGANLLDAVAPDANPVAYANAREQGRTPWAVEETVQDVADIGLGLLSNARNVADWAGQTEILDRVLPGFSTATATAQAIERQRMNASATEMAVRDALGEPSFEAMRQGSMFNRAADSVRGWADGQGSEESQARGQALSQAMNEGFGSTVGFLASAEGVESLTQDLLPGSVPYMAGGMGVSAGLRAAGLGARAAATGGATATSFTTTLGNAQEAEDAVRSLSPEALANTPRARELLAQNHDIEHVREVLAREARMKTIAASVAISPASVIPALNPLERIAAGAAANPLATGIQRATLATLAGISGEAVQEGGERLQANLGEVGAGVRAVEDTGEGVAGAALTGAVMGGPIAGGAELASANVDFANRADRLRRMAGDLEAESAERVRQAEERRVAEEARQAARARELAPQFPLVRNDGGERIVGGTPWQPEPTERVSEGRLDPAQTEPTWRPEDEWQGPLSEEGQVAADMEYFERQRDAREAQRNFIGWNTLESSNAALRNSLREGPRGVFPGARLNDAAMANEDIRMIEQMEQSMGTAGAQSAAVSMPTTVASDAALQNSLREGPRGVNPGPRLDDRAMAGEDARNIRSIAQQNLEEASFEEEAMSRLRNQEVAREQRAAVEGEVAALDSKSSAADLKKAQQKHRADRRSYLEEVRKANASRPQEERVQILADAAQTWDAANPAPTAESVAAAVQAAPAPRRRGQRTAVPSAPAVDPAQLAEAGATEEEIAAAQAAPVEQVSSRIEALRNRRAGRADSTPVESTGRSAADVVRDLAQRVAKGNSRAALAQEQLLLNGKLSVVDPDVMNEVAGGPARGYYDGERMYINADVIPEGEVAGHIFNEILAHEADHAARISENKDARSKVRILLGDTATEKLLDQLYDSNHPTAVAAREMVAQAGVTEESDIVRYEDELTAYAISQAMADSATAKWAPIRGLVSAARRKWKDFTGSDDLNLDDLAVYAQRTIDALATSNEGIAGQTDGREMIVGPNAANWDSMDNRYRGRVDGMERSEISDQLAEIDTSDDTLINMLVGKRKSLEEFLNHPALFENYPQLRNRTVRVVDLGEAIFGGFDGRNLVLDSALVERAATDPVEAELLRRVVLHEVQHAVQQIEGFVGGANTEDFIPSSILEDYKFAASAFERTFNDFNLAQAVNTLSEQDKAVWQQDARDWAAFNDDIDPRSDEAMRLLKRKFLNENWGALSNNQLIRAKQQKFDERKAALGPANDAYQAALDVAFERYQRVYGEAEARNTETRSRMSDADLRRFPVELTMGLAPDGVNVEDTTPAPRGRRANSEARAGSVREAQRQIIEAEDALMKAMRAVTQEQVDAVRELVDAVGRRSREGISDAVQAAEAHAAGVWQAVAQARDPSTMLGRTARERADIDAEAVAQAIIGNIADSTAAAIEEVANTGTDFTRRRLERELNGVDNVFDMAGIVGRTVGRASTVAPRTTAPYQPEMNSKWKRAMKKVPAPILDAVTVAGAAGKGMFNLSQDAENARNSVYQTALSYNARLDRAFDKAAKAKGVTKQQLNDTIMKRLEAIAAIPNVVRKDTLIARIGQEYPELSGLVEAIQDINAQTDAIIDARLADPREISEEELSRLEYMDRNKYSYLTNVYAAFQGKEGREYKNRMLDHYEKAKAIVEAGGTVPENIKREYDTYSKALRWVVANDVAVSDPEQLAALPIEDVEGLYNMWSPNRDTAENLRTRMTNEGSFDVNAYRDFMADNIAEWVEGADTETLENLGNAVLQNLLNNNPVSGPARRYGRGGGLDDSILQHRKEVPPALQELYGKVSDIPALINATLTRQGELAERMRFFNRMRDEVNERGMPYVVTQREAAEQFPEYTVRLSGKSYGAVNGMYTTPEIARSIDDYTQESVTLADTLALVGSSPSIARKFAGQKWFENWTKLAGMQKAMKIITRPDYLLMNFAGSIFTPVLTGGVSLTDMNRGRKVVQEHLAHTINPAKDEQISMDLRLALEMGLFDNAVTQEIRRAPRQMVQRMIREMTHADDLSKLNEVGNQFQGAARRTWNTLVEAYSMSDAWAKIPVGLRRIDYLRAYYDANGDDVSNEQIVREAAAFVRDSTIGMQAVPAGVKLGERLGLTFYAPYFYSAFRALGRAPMNMWNDAKMAIDAKTPEARNIAATSAALKATGIATTAVAMTGAMKQLADSLMDDEEREQADRDRALMFPGEAITDNIYLGKDAAGRRLYFNLSRIDQWGPATDIYRALRENPDKESAAKIVAESMVDLIIMNRAFGPLLNTLVGKDKNTQLERVMDEKSQMAKDVAASVTEKLGSPEFGYEAMDFLLDMGDLVTPAGVMNYLDPNNTRPQDVDGRSREFIASVMSALGHKFVAVDEKQALGMAARELSKHRSDARNRIRDTVAANGPQAGLEAHLRESRRERELVADLGKKWESVTGGDTSPRQAAAMLKDADLDARTISNISKKAYMAETDEWARNYSDILSTRSISNAPFSRRVETPEQKKAREKKWAEEAREVRRRLRARSYAEENNDGN